MAGVAPRMKELFSKYGRVAVAVHLSVSAVSVAGFYVAIQSKVDVGPVLEKIGLFSQKEARDMSQGVSNNADDKPPRDQESGPASAAAAGGALALAILCNKALFPVRVPVTLALTPPIARFLARRNLYRSI